MADKEVLGGLTVIDLSWGVAGPLTGMLMADQGAMVTKIDPPMGDPFESLSGYRVWQRGKHRRTIDLRDDAARAQFLDLVDDADVLIESFGAGTADQLGVTPEILLARNPRLIYCSIGGYAGYGPDADRPAYEGLVAARTGHQWEGRGFPGGTPQRLSGLVDVLDGFDAEPRNWEGPPRPGPVFSGVPWLSLGAFYNATIGINAALRARELTGRGQHVSTSLLQGALLSTTLSWFQAEHADFEGFSTWGVDPRAPKGFMKASDGRWTHHFTALPEFITGAAANDMRITPDVPGPKTASMRFGPGLEDIVVMRALMPDLADDVARHPSADWVRAASEVGVPVQTVRSPEEALLDPALLADGCVVDVEDPELGTLRQVGRVISFSELTTAPGRPAQSQPVATRDHVERPAAEGALASPLAGIRVLDLGMVVAAPYGVQLLAQLGAEVVKVTTQTDKVWQPTHIAMSANRDREAIAIDLKNDLGKQVFQRLVANCDVVVTNMRYDAAVRLGVDYESLKSLKPDVIYAHILGHDTGARALDPGNDQTAAALAGTTWLDGQIEHGGRPFWSLTSLGDLGAGALAATGVVQALRHRDRTGSGQFIQTSILYAHLLNASMAWISPDSVLRGQRQQLDAESLGWSALYRLYDTADGWLCIQAEDESSWRAMVDVLSGALAADGRFTTAQGRAKYDEDLVRALTAAFSTGSAVDWFTRLDAAGVPCEISDPLWVTRLFADPDAGDLVARLRHPKVGDVTCSGLLMDFSDTPGVLRGSAPLPGQHTRAIMAEHGYSEAEIDELVRRGAVEEG